MTNFCFVTPGKKFSMVIGAYAVAGFSLAEQAESFSFVVLFWVGWAGGLDAAMCNRAL